MDELKKYYNSIDLEWIKNAIKEKKEEDLYLEFKTITKPDLSCHDDKKNLAKVLSGFANSSGGIVIWGIVAKKDNQNEYDCASEEKEINNLSVFISKLNQLTGQFVLPIVDGVLHKKIESSSNTGFVKTFIPQSDSSPHMAKGGEDRYYKRSGDSFYRMEHFDIEDMFGVRKKPILEIHSEIKKGISFHSQSHFFEECKIIIGLKNNGKGITKYPYFTLSLKSPFDNGMIENNRLPEINHSYDYEKKIYGGYADNVIHSGSEMEIVTIKIFIDKKSGILGNEKKIDDLSINYEMAAEGLNLKTGTLVIKKEEILK